MALAHVFDTYAKTNQGRIMHFDVIIEDKNLDTALHYAKAWLASIGHADAEVSAKTCCFCHSAEPPPAMQQEIAERGYAIYKMEGCS